MATDTFPQSNPAAKSMARTDFNVTDLARAILAPLASLKLTVFLLVIATLVTFIGTLEQTRQDIDGVKHRYFMDSQIFVEVPFQTFFVPAWFPKYQNVPGSVRIPSGMTILVIMIINLTAAHVLRFRLQASGVKLAIGLITALIAGVITWAIIFNSSSAHGIQGEPPIPWYQMWIVLQIVVLGIACAAGFGFFTIARSRRIEKVLLALAAVTFGALLIVTLVLGRDAFIGDSAMRIVWQLTQATIAASISLIACMLLFNRKAGIVLLHLGIVGLMANEIYVNATNNEQQMTIFEGETISEAVDIRTTELAIIDTSDSEFDEVISVPEGRLMTGEVIDDPNLPVKIKLVQFFANSDLKAANQSPENLATQGNGLNAMAVEKPISNGTDTEQVADLASAYVELFDKKSDKPMGTFLVSQLLKLNRSNNFIVDGKTYCLALRFKTDYKPVSITLKDVEAEYYPGTSTPRKFSSQIVLNDLKSDSEFEHKIWMNNPLRFAGETFYQQSYGKSPVNGEEHTVLQVVKNRGWMIPYVCCMFTVVGLLVQFGSSLLSYLEKQQSTAKGKLKSDLKETEADKSAGSRQSGSRPWLLWLPTAVIAGTFALYVGGEWYKASHNKIDKDGMRLDLLGQLPVMQNGRVQPLDSFARHTALRLSKRETVKNRNETSQPAIRWLADMIFRAEGYDEYRLFRIEDPELHTALDLPFPMPTPERAKHSNLRYTLAEVLAARSKIRELLPKTETDQSEWTLFQTRIADVSTKLNRVFFAEMCLGFPEPEENNLFLRLEQAGMAAESPMVPLVYASTNPDKPWISFLSLQNQAWLSELGQKHNAATTEALGAAIIEKEVLPGLRDDMIRARSIQRLMGQQEMVELLQEKTGEKDPAKLEQMIASTWDSMPADSRQEIEEAEGPMVDSLLNNQRTRYVTMMSQQLALINEGPGPLKTTSVSDLGSLLLKLRPAYQSNDTETFNKTLTDYLTAVSSNPPTEMSRAGVATESWYNGFAPFYLAMVIYLFTVVIYGLAMLFGLLGSVIGTISQTTWQGWNLAWSRFAFWMLTLGVLVHITGLVARVMISGRPPITNLYSSFLFVSMVIVLGMLILERISKIGVTYVLGGLGGFLTLLAAWNMTLTDGDTFAVLMAVLDTQFWLATHVVCISIGYAATLMAGLLGLAYVAITKFNPAIDKKNSRDFANVIYGVICFGLVTSFFGTVLGGLWADDSWGRFWGWDPKENGALMIVLWNAVSLHARWGGIVRERGLAMLAIFGNVVVLWSWKGVNAMGVGLHAYGGTEDATMKYILLFGLFSLFMLVVAMIPTSKWLGLSRD